MDRFPILGLTAEQVHVASDSRIVVGKYSVASIIHHCIEQSHTASLFFQEYGFNIFCVEVKIAVSVTTMPAAVCDYKSLSSELNSMKFGLTWLAFVLGCCLLMPMKGNAQAVKDTPAGEIATQDAMKLYWIFLTTGKSTEGVKPEVISEMQKAHLANFKRLAGEGKLLTAGPMSDPEEKLRGIVVVKAESSAKLAGFFQEDPYIQKGYLKIEATEMEFDHGAINTKITPQGLEEFRLVVFEKTSEQKTMEKQQRVDNQEFISAMSSDKDLRLTVLLPKGDFDRTALMILAKPGEDQTIADRLKELPAIKSGVWRSRIFPLFMGKGSLVSAG